MASLKEVKERISSVKSTQKITGAMKMIASAKLRKAQGQIERFQPYQQRLNEILEDFLASETDFVSPFAEKRDLKSVAVVVISSNSSLCGAFNSNIIKLFEKEWAAYRDLLRENGSIYPIGRKIYNAVVKMGLKPEGDYFELSEKPDFEGAKAIMDLLMADFLAKKIDRVELIYTHFKSTSSQQLVCEQLLPIVLPDKKTGTTIQATDYIVEPDKASVIASLLPKSLRSKLYAAILDSAAAEHAARTVAMQIATDNAADLLDELIVQYNKTRQQAITSELLDIVSGSEALK
ncbi:MAG: F0F1 ATP synthase subunit gamma [Candidatus Azobacteroides sp.]|nr:F0F1 ATP synthase subunit gamma [Candidatus Azobacteroides sp.]